MWSEAWAWLSWQFCTAPMTPRLHIPLVTHPEYTEYSRSQVVRLLCYHFRLLRIEKPPLYFILALEPEYDGIIQNETVNLPRNTSTRAHLLFRHGRLSQLLPAEVKQTCRPHPIEHLHKPERKSATRGFSLHGIYLQPANYCISAATRNRHKPEKFPFTL